MRTLLVTLFFLAVTTLSAEPLWPRSELQYWVDYRHPAPLSANADLSPYFKDVPYPRGILFSTKTGSIYWYDAGQDTVTCLLPLNGVVDGLSMTADRSLYSFSLDGQPYLWRPATQPGINLVQLNVGNPNSWNYYEVALNATGTAGLETHWWSDDHESGRTRTILDLKAMTYVRSESDANWEFTPSGTYVVDTGYDYERRDDRDNPTRYSEVLTFTGKSVKRFEHDLVRDEGRFDTRMRWERDGPEAVEWYQGGKIIELPSWETMGLPAGTAYVPAVTAHRADAQDGLEVSDDGQTRILTRRTADNAVLWRRKMRTYGEAAGSWLDGQGKTLLVLTTRPGPPRGPYDFPGPRAVLRQYDWRTGERSAADIELTGNDAGTILEWEPGRFVAVSTGTGVLEYSFATQKIVTGNGTTPIRGRAITSFYPSMTGSLSYDKDGKVLTLPRFAGQVGGITSFVVREDQALVATMDEVGQVALRRVGDGELLALTRYDGGLDPAPLAGLTEADFKAVFAAPSASAAYRTAAGSFKAGPGYNR